MRLSKYHGLGNDFIMGKHNELSHLDYASLAKKVCHRHSGFGADGLIVVKENPLEMIYYNSDGSRAEMCGNGIRCLSKYVYDEKLISDLEYDIHTFAGVMHIKVESTDPFMVRVNMGKPNYDPSDFASKEVNEMIDYALTIDNEEIITDSLLLGVPHTLVAVEELNVREMLYLGPLVEKNVIFDKGTNVNFYEVINKNHIQMQTYERGAGLTLACGTGACATFALLHRKGIVNQKVNVSLPLGDLIISEVDGNIIMTGPAEKVGDVFLEDLK